jgi:hypothetical protein
MLPLGWLLMRNVPSLYVKVSRPTTLLLWLLMNRLPIVRWGSLCHDDSYSRLILVGVRRR